MRTAETAAGRADGLELRLAWRRGDSAIEADTVAFWNRLGILPGGVAPEARVKELAAAAYRDGKLVGVTTVVPTRLDFLRARFAVLRGSVDPAYRRGGAATELAIFTRDLIEAWAAEHPEERIAGLAAVLESPDLIARQKQLYWPRTRLGLVGFTPQGRQIRVAWFPHFRLD